MDYRNFDLWVEAHTVEGFPLRAHSETQGAARGLMTLDPTSTDVQGYLRRLESWKTDEAFLQEWGTLLYNALFTGDIESLFQLSLGEVIDREEWGLRIRLRIAPPAIAALPWEYTYTPRQNYFLGTSPKTPLTRYLEVMQPTRSLKVALPLKVLIAIPGGSGLDTRSEERGSLEEALGRLGNAVQIRFLEGHVTRSTVSDALLEEQYHIFHFIGHGAFENEQGYLVFNGEEGEDPISDGVFARFFLEEPSMKLILLNACEGARVSSSQAMVGMASRLVERGIPAVIAHQYPVTNREAIRFAREFYRSLCVGTEAGHVDVAVAHARNQLSIHFSGDRSLGAPVLFMRAPDGLIFDLLPGPSPLLGPRPPLSDKERQRLEHLLSTHERTLRVLEEQINKMGAFAPASIKTQLEDEKAAIQEIKEKLSAPA